MTVDYDSARTRNRPYEMVKLAFDSCKIVEYVCVIEFQIVQYCRSGRVVQKLGSLVEESGVVFVRLDHEMTGLGQPRGKLEVCGSSTDQKPRILRAPFEDPCEHCRSCRFSMGSSNSEHPLTCQHMIMEPLRAGDETIASVENRLHQRVAARHDVADYPEIRLEAELIGTIAIDQIDADGPELVAHRRIDIGIATGHAMARLARDDGHAAHEGAANPEQVKVQAQTPI